MCTLPVLYRLQVQDKTSSILMETKENVHLKLLTCNTFSLINPLTLSNDCKADRGQSTATMGCTFEVHCHKAATSLPTTPRCWVSMPTFQ